MPAIYEIYGTDAHLMAYSLMSAADVAAMIPKKASIALKPNLVIAAGPEGGATTHPGVLSGCIAYLQENGFSDISVIEGSWVGDNTDRAMKACGYDKVCRDCNVPFYDLKKDKTRKVDTRLRPMEITCRALDTDFLIDLPVLKGHCQTNMTCALKNLKGCLPDREKRKFHSDGLIKPIAALAAYLKPSLVIADSACSACYASLVRALYVADKERIPVREEISIGQGFRGKKTDGIGIGNCCRGFSQCVTGCPPTASDVIDVFKRKAESGSRI